MGHDAAPFDGFAAAFLFCDAGAPLGTASL
jgi:hypothetical protein